MFDDPQTEDMRDLLQSVEADTARTSSNRERIRQSVLTTFDDAIVKTEPEVIHLVSVDGGSRRLISSPRVLGWAAAAAAAVLLVFFAVSGGPTQLGSTGPADSGTTDESRLSLSDPDLPAALLPGPQTTDSIAGGLSFDAPDGLAVIAEDDGQLLLEVADEPGVATGQLIIVETKLSDWEAELGALEEAGQVHIKPIGVVVDGRATTRLDVTVANGAESCTPGEPCIRLDGWPATGPAALWAGADNRIVEIGRTDNSLVLAIEVSQRFTSPLSNLAAQVINTASLSPN